MGFGRSGDGNLGGIGYFVELLGEGGVMFCSHQQVWATKVLDGVGAGSICMAFLG